MRNEVTIICQLDQLGVPRVPAVLGGVWRTIPVAVTSRTGSSHHVDIRVVATVARICGPDFENLGRAVGFVDQMVTVRIARLEGRTVTCAQDLFAGVGNESQLPLYNPDKLILVTVPMAL